MLKRFFSRLFRKKYPIYNCRCIYDGMNIKKFEIYPEKWVSKKEYDKYFDNLIKNIRKDFIPTSREFELKKLKEERIKKLKKLNE